MHSAGILIVDDIVANLEIVSQILEDADYETATALDGERALKLVTSYPPDLILLDVQMPGIDGFETCRLLKKDPKTAAIPIIFMTALDDTDSKVKGFDLGAVDYITKPFQEKELLARVRTHLQLRQWSKTLETRVSEKTYELKMALEHLQKSHLQLVQSEKLATLGNIVAGVAHEINNPVNFIHGNVTHVRGYVQDLLELRQLYEQHYPDPAAEIREKTEDIDIDFIEEDLPKTLASMQIGSDRIREIVCSLRNFSRLDEAEYKLANVHDGLNSTLTILGHRLNKRTNRPTIQVTKDYDSRLPDIECYPGPLNQVFMNLLSNSIDALEEKFEKQTPQERQEDVGQITLRTTLIDDSWVQIAIADNGMGILDDVKPQIFEPFFTTKPVGRGTGMGMSISHQIVAEKHKGKIVCRSAFGTGTEMIIQIPLQKAKQ